MIRGAIFDVDGTILDTMATWEEMGERYLRSIGIEPEPHFSEVLFTMTVPEGAEYTKERYHLDKTAEEISQEILDMIRDFYYYEAPAKPGIKSFLENMKKHRVPMVIATSCEREHVTQAFLRLGILEYFDEIFTCTEVGEGKTSPLIYQRAAEYLKIEPEDIFVFEDAIHAVETASKAGFVTIAVKEPFGRQHEKQIREHAAYFLQSWKDQEGFWNWVYKEEPK